MGAGMTGRGSRRWPRDDRGAVAVEFALVLPVLIVLVFGVVDFGRVFFAQISVTQAAREGSRLAALANTMNPQLTPAAVISRTKAAANGLPAGSLNVNAPICPAGSTAATDAVVSVKHTVTFSTPMAGLAGLPGSVVVTGTGHMPCHG